jgi:hypothetical protein
MIRAVAKVPYRENVPPPDEPPDPEHAAIAIMAQRTRRARGAVAVGSLLVGLAIAGGLYQFFWDYYEAHGLPIPLKMIAITSLTMGLIPALVAGPRISSLWIRGRRDGWLDELAREKGLDRAELDEMTRSFSG